MNRSYSSLRDGQRLPFESSLVKTYLIESHQTESGDHDDLRSILLDSFHSENSPLTGRGEVEETDEDSFFRLTLDTPSGHANLYVDATEPRFWFVHSVDSSGAVDWTIDGLVSYSQKLDNGWFPVELLEFVASHGDMRGLGIDYDRREMPDVDFDSPEAPVEFLKMQLWGNKAARVLEILRREDAFPHETTLSKVKVKYWAPTDKSDEDFTLDDIKFAYSTETDQAFHTHADQPFHVMPIRSERSDALGFPS